MFSSEIKISEQLSPLWRVLVLQRLRNAAAIVNAQARAWYTAYAVHYFSSYGLFFLRG